MKKILLATVVLALVSGCSLFRKKGDSSTGGSDSSIRSETTANGGTESFDGSPMNFSASGSDTGSIEGLQTVFFPYDSSAITPEEKEKMLGNIEWLKKNPSAKLTIEGHTDSRGSNEYNLALGERRANAARQFLLSNGVAASRLATVSFGEEKPLAQGESEDAWARNRRANFVPVK